MKTVINWIFSQITSIQVWIDAKDMENMGRIMKMEKEIQELERDIIWIRKTGKGYWDNQNEIKK